MNLMKIMNKLKSLITTESDCNNDCYQGRACSCNSVEVPDLSKKILDSKLEKGRLLSEALWYSDKEYEVGDLEACEKFSRNRDSSRK